MSELHDFGWGEPAPWFSAPLLNGSTTFEFSSVAGRHVVLLFLGSAAHESSARALALARHHRALFDDKHACFFGVTGDPADIEHGRISEALPGMRFFLDYDGSVSQICGAFSGREYRPHWLVLDRRLRVAGRFNINDGESAIRLLKTSIEQVTPANEWAPALVLTNVLEPEFCEELIALFDADGGEPSGFMRDVDGKTVAVFNPKRKQRRDVRITDEGLQRRIAARIIARACPAIKQAFQFEATRIERYLVACYRQGAGHFGPHRDNTTKGTAHRRFAMTLNLNAGDYDGGDLRFPEFGNRTYRAPTGGAVVFSCSLLHEATPVTRGKRYALLPFLYDEHAVRVREENNCFLEEERVRYETSELQTEP